MTDIPNQIDEEDVPYIKLSKISDDESPVDFNQRLSKIFISILNLFIIFYSFKKYKINASVSTGETIQTGPSQSK